MVEFNFSNPISFVNFEIKVNVEEDRVKGKYSIIIPKANRTFWQY